MAGKCDGLNPVFDCHQQASSSPVFHGRLLIHAIAISLAGLTLLQEPFDSCCVEFLELPMANMTEASGDQPEASTDPEASIDLSEGEMQVVII